MPVYETRVENCADEDFAAWYGEEKASMEQAVEDTFIDYRDSMNFGGEDCVTWAVIEARLEGTEEVSKFRVTQPGIIIERL